MTPSAPVAKGHPSDITPNLTLLAFLEGSSLKTHLPCCAIEADSLYLCIFVDPRIAASGSQMLSSPSRLWSGEPPFPPQPPWLTLYLQLPVSFPGLLPNECLIYGSFPPYPPQGPEEATWKIRSIQTLGLWGAKQRKEVGNEGQRNRGREGRCLQHSGQLHTRPELMGGRKDGLRLK